MSFENLEEQSQSMAEQPESPSGEISSGNVPEVNAHDREEMREEAEAERSEALEKIRKDLGIGGTPESEKNLEIYPELDLIRDIFSKELIVIGKDDLGMPKYNIDTEHVLALIDQRKPLFDRLKKEQAERIERTPIPPASEMQEFAQHMIDEVKGDFVQLDILPEGFAHAEAKLSPLTLSYDQEKNYGRYLDYRHFHDPDDPEPPSAIIDVGGKYIRGKATHLRDDLEKMGISMDIDESLRLVTKHLIAHEYGHRVTDAAGPEDAENRHPFYKNIAALGRDDTMHMENNGEALGILDEQMSQSFAGVVLSKTLVEKGYEGSVLQAMNKVVGPDEATVKKFKDFLGFIEQQGLKQSDVEAGIWEIEDKLKESGNTELYQYIQLNFRNIGYYLETFTPEELRSIVKG